MQCTTCGFLQPLAPAGTPCPRCLLLGATEEELEEHPTESSYTTSGPALDTLAADELAAELPAFELIECIARGGMGIVWRARERILDRQVAIKLLLNPQQDPQFVERFNREARVMAQLRHPHIVTLYSFGRTRSNHCYLVMELMERRCIEKDQPPPTLTDSLRISSQVCDALIHAHSLGFIHRDIKPGNVLLDSQMNAKLGDFGLARLGTQQHHRSTINLTGHGVALGTPHYMAPEQAQGQGLEDHRADIYSLGILLYQMLTGDVPRGIFTLPSSACSHHPQPPKGRVRAQLFRKLDSIIQHSLQASPEQRYPSASYLYSALHSARELVDPHLIAEKQRHQYTHRWHTRRQLALGIAVSMALGFIIAWYAREWTTPRASPSLSSPIPIQASTRITQLPTQHWGITPDSIQPVKSVIILRPTSLPGRGDFGRRLALWDSWLAVSTTPHPHHPSPHVYLYQHQNQQWHLRQTIIAPPTRDPNYRGPTLSLQPGSLLVGSRTQTPEGLTTEHLHHYTYQPGLNQWQPHTSPTPALPDQDSLWSLTLAHTQQHLLTCSGQKQPHENRILQPELMLYTTTPDHKNWTPLPWPENITHSLSALPIASQGNTLYAFTTQLQSNGQRVRSLLLHHSSQQQQQLIPLPEHPDTPVTRPNSITASPHHIIIGYPDHQQGDGTCWPLQRHPSGHITPLALIPPPAGAEKSEFGKALALHHPYLAITADHTNKGKPYSGSVHLYQHQPSSSQQQPWQRILTLHATPSMNASDLGQSVQLSPTHLIIGAPASPPPPEDSTTSQATGAVIIVEFTQPLTDSSDHPQSPAPHPAP